MSTADQVIAVAMAQRGKRYVFGTAGPNTFDCSGLVVYAFKNGAGISLPHFTGSLWAKGSPVSKANIAPGDLVFPNPSHVGIAISHTQIVVAPHTGTVVKVQNITTVWGVRRIIAPGTGIGARPALTPVGLPGQDQITQLYGVFQSANKMAQYLGDSKNWVRGGLIASGFALMGYGLWNFETSRAIMQSTVKGIKNIPTGGQNVGT